VYLCISRLIKVIIIMHGGNLKLSGSCYAIRLMVCVSNINTVKSIYYAYFHSVIKYRIIFLVNSSNNGKIFTLQKKIVRIMARAQPRTSDRNLFKQLENLPVPCQYIFSLMNFIINNQEILQISIVFIDQMPL
jgi:hypothetical protein